MLYGHIVNVDHRVRCFRTRAATGTSGSGAGFRPLVAPAVAGTLAEGVREVLVHLFDPAYLQRHPLARALAQRDPGLSPVQAGITLRRKVLEAIASLNPANGMNEKAPTWRRYRLLEMRYVDALDTATVRERLCLSRSQYYRDHAHAVASVVTLLAELQ
jgi:hypothetical protein